MKCFQLFLIICILSFRGWESIAQKRDKQIVRQDTFAVKADHFFIIEKSAYYVPRDTVFILPDTVDCYVKKHSIEGTNKFYNSLVKKLSKNKYSNLLYKLVFEKEEEKKAKEREKEKSDVEHSKKRYLKYEGKTVNQINLRDLKVFGTDVDDTTKLETSVITKTVNRFHVHTRDQIIKQNLLITEGNKIKSSELADNERVIRQLDYIQDARIYVGESKVNSERANLYVVTRDLFPLKFDYSTNAETSTSSIGISNINIFGTGHELENNIVINDQGSSSFGYDGYYRVPNLAGTFLSGEVNYISTFRSTGSAVKVFRNFYTPDVIYAGGVELSSKTNNQFRAFDNVTDSVEIVSHKENFQDIWFARSFKAFHVPSILRKRERLRFIVSGRITRKRYVERPEVTEDFNVAFHDRVNVLAAVGLSSRGYFKDRFIRSFGRTEDIPVGTSIQLTAGRQFGEFFDRNYFGLELSEGDIFKNFGYLKGTMRLGGFYRRGTLEQGVFNLKGEYFSRLYTMNYFKFRQFITVNYTKGIRRKSQDFIDINDVNGIRGIYNFFLTGTERFVINTESVLFTPLQIGGFRAAFFGFFDLGVINSSRAGDVYYGTGLGVRLKNDNLALNTIQLRFGFYPALPFQSSENRLNFSTIGSLRLEDFDISSPEVVEFR